MEFEWDDGKARSNIDKHDIDFADAVRIFDGFVLESRSDRVDEERWKALGELKETVLFVVYTVRAGRRRIISAREASRDERAEYRSAKPV